MAITPEIIHQQPTQLTEAEAEPEPVAEIVTTPAQTVVGSFENLAESKNYLASLVGREVVASAKVTHKVAELTGFLVNQSRPEEIHSAHVLIEEVHGSYVIYTDKQTGTQHTSFIAFFRLESELE